MFTGIIEAKGQIKAININGEGARVTVAVGKLDMSDVNLGDSIATNGVCLTVVSFDNTSFSADVSKETLTRTGFTHYHIGQTVNLEKAMLPTTRFGGHIVSGHVDAVGEVLSVVDNGNSTEYWLSMSEDIALYVAEKGSITVDGISLTVNALSADKFRLTIVPHTAQETIISQYQVGTKVNLEVDVMARYIERLLTKNSNKTQEKSGVTEALLMQSGIITK
ncbi:riboflavin synthase [Thalassotalea atypica]|uniref:riboflavin synthase n=1 Tax=Thalassotalea atypica TaxID=2054316 RepID=UPI0025738BA6|nr:riboflavin synthase [Thalassotalea atypica]